MKVATILFSTKLDINLHKVSRTSLFTKPGWKNVYTLQSMILSTSLVVLGPDQGNGLHHF